MDCTNICLEDEIHEVVSQYISAVLGIKNARFCSIIATAFLKDEIGTVEQILEPEHVKKLARQVAPLLAAHENAARLRHATGYAMRSIESGVSAVKGEYDPHRPSSERPRGIPSRRSSSPGEDSGDARDAQRSEDGKEQFTHLKTPFPMAEREKETPRPAGLSGFIYQIEHDNDSDSNIEDTVESKFNEIQKALSQNQVVLVQGNTGCGKTTKIPYMLLKTYGRIVCTQPRRLAAISIAKRVASIARSPLGELIGYAVRFDEKHGKHTRLKYVTDGLLLKELAALQENGHCHGQRRNHESARFKYDLVIIDEAHERSLNMDILMGYFKAMHRIKLLVMSATLDTQKFVDYFNCPLIQIRHKLHKVEQFYLKESPTDYVKSAIQAVCAIINAHKSGDVLVFLTGQDDIGLMHGILSEKLSGSGPIAILKLHSAMPSSEQEMIFAKGPRKIILSTNIAETSITIDSIKFVVDSGKVKQMRRSPTSSIDFLETIPISQSQATQRAGRAGRTGPGSVYRLYTRAEYEAMKVSAVPEILRANLSTVILSLKALNINNIVNFSFIDCPPVDSINASIRFLYYLKAVDEGGRITQLGKKLAAIPLEPELAMALLTARRLKCLDAVATISAFLNAPPIYLSARGASGTKRPFRHPKGDFYTYLHIYNEWRKCNFSYSFATKHSLNMNSMQQVLNIKLQLLGIKSYGGFGGAKKVALNLRHSDQSYEEANVIEQSFCSGYFMNIAKKSGSVDGYTTLFGGLACSMHPNDGLYKAHPKLVLFHEIVCIKKEYMRTCLAIDPKTLSEACNFIR